MDDQEEVIVVSAKSVHGEYKRQRHNNGCLEMISISNSAWKIDETLTTPPVHQY
jgi:hypothetical protein